MGRDHAARHPGALPVQRRRHHHSCASPSPARADAQGQVRRRGCLLILLPPGCLIADYQACSWLLCFALCELASCEDVFCCFRALQQCEVLTNQAWATHTAWCRGNDVQAVEFSSSPHCGHLKAHPAQYSAAVESHLRQVLGGSGVKQALLGGQAQHCFRWQHVRMSSLQQSTIFCSGTCLQKISAAAGRSASSNRTDEVSLRLR